MKINSKQSSKDGVTNNSASKSLKIEKKAKSQLGKEQLLHSSQEPHVQAFTESHVDGSLDVNMLTVGGGCNNIFNSLSEKKKELIYNFPSQEGGGNSCIDMM